ncbi:TPA: hypothetical protein DCX15_03545 [bacterium]|nr:hypothetical protein [bacterium]
MRYFYVIITTALLTLIIVPEDLLAEEKESLKEDSIILREKLPLIIDEPLNKTLSSRTLSEMTSPVVVPTPSSVPSGIVLKGSKKGSFTQLKKREGVTPSSSLTTPSKMRSGAVSGERLSAHFKEERVKTVGEMIASFIPEALKALKDKENLQAPLFEEKQRGTEKNPFISEEEASLIAETPKIETTSQAAKNKKVVENITLSITGLGIVSFFGLASIFIVKRLKQRKRAAAPAYESKENVQTEDLRSDSIYKGWWYDDFKDLQKTYKETIKDLNQKVETRILTIEGNQNRLSRAFTEIESKLERISSLINRGIRKTKEVKVDPSSLHERVIRLSRDGLKTGEIAQITRLGKSEVELILKNCRLYE